MAKGVFIVLGKNSESVVHQLFAVLSAGPFSSVLQKFCE